MDNKPKAITYMLFSAFAFAMMSATVKLSGDIPVFEKVFFRNLISLFIAYYVIKKSGARLFGKKENQKYLLARSFLGLTGVILNFYAINHLILADSSMLNKLSPFFVTIFAVVFLNEKLEKYQIPALLIAFIGALLVIKPEFDIASLPAFAGLISAVLAGGAYTLIRFLRNREHPSTIIFYFSLISVLGMIPLMMTNFVLPSPEQFVFLIATGIFAAMGQLGLTYAYKYAPAGEISIFNYANIVFSALIGFALWGEIPDTMSVFGGSLIVLAAVTTFLASKRVLKKASAKANA